jgi:hypothetical protein
MSDERDRDPSPTPGLGADSLPGLARIAATSMWRTSGWAVRTYIDVNRRLIGVVLRPDSASELLEDVRTAAADATENLGGSEGVANRVRPTPAKAPPSLQNQGEELLRRSRDVRYEEAAHPAHERILSELAPDEARILRLLFEGGPQPSVDVRTGGPIGMFSSRLIAPGLNMIGARAGCRYVDRVPSYLNNLYRLGLVWFSRETLRDPHEYQVVEAQPDVLEAMKSVRMAKLVRRSIHLTPFGADFCRDALSLDTAEFAALPAHGSPDEAKAAATPPVEH